MTILNDMVNNNWTALLQAIVDNGQQVTARGQATVELMATQTIWPMSCPVITIRERKLGYKFMPAEAAWILRGDYRVDSIAPYSKAIANFSDDGEHFFGAYGPKIMQQIIYVIRNLEQDISSRQAVINIWRESPPQSKDVPCTLSLQWLIRGTELHCVAQMRSSDIWLGVPYDVFNFSMVSAYLLLCLRQRNEWAKDVTLGQLFLRAGSQHYYIRNEDAIHKILEEPTSAFNVEEINLDEFPHPHALVQHLQDVADRRFLDLDDSPAFLHELYQEE